jgi:hypothetical protein
MTFQFTSEYAIRKIQQYQMEIEFNGTYKLLVYADDVNQLGCNILTINEDTDALIHFSNDVRLEVNAENPMNVLLSRHQNAGQTNSK